MASQCVDMLKCLAAVLGCPDAALCNGQQLPCENSLSICFQFLALGKKRDHTITKREVVAPIALPNT
jgi:hypothetical protein